MQNIVAAEKTIELSVVVNAPVDQVWEAWTTADGIKTFFAPGARVELRAGGPFEVYFDPTAQPGQRGADDMRILAFQEKKMLSFTWNAPPHLPEARQQHTVVVVRLEPTDQNQTRVTLNHLGWGEGGEWDKAHEYFTSAWPRVLESLQKRFVAGPTDWTSWLDQLKEKGR